MMIGININATTAEESEKIKAIEKVVRDAYEILTPQNKEFSLKDIKDSIVKTGDSHIPIQLERYLANPLFNKTYDALQFNKKFTTLRYGLYC